MKCLARSEIYETVDLFQIVLQVLVEPLYLILG